MLYLHEFASLFTLFYVATAEHRKSKSGLVYFNRVHFRSIWIRILNPAPFKLRLEMYNVPYFFFKYKYFYRETEFGKRCRYFLWRSALSASFPAFVVNHH